MAALAHRLVAALEQLGQTAIREALFLERAQLILADGVQAGGLQFEFDLHDLLDLGQEPRIDMGQLIHLVKRHAQAEGVAHVPDALGAGSAEFLLQHFAVLGLLVEAVNADFQTAQGLLERLLECASHGHHLAHRLHLGREVRVSGREFLEGETRNLGDHVVDAGLEAGRRGTAGDFVAQFVQRVAHGQLGRDLGDRKAGGLGGQGRGARHARVHFDHDHAPVHRVDRELHVRAAGVDADLAQHRQAGVAHDLVFLVAQGLGRRNRDRVAGVHAHRVQVLDRTDDDAVVGLVAHDLHLELFPAEQGLLDQQFAGR